MTTSPEITDNFFDPDIPDDTLKALAEDGDPTMARVAEEALASRVNIRRWLRITSMNMEVNEQNEIDIEMKSQMTILLAYWLGKHLTPESPNFITMNLSSPDESVGPFEITFKRRWGKSPAELLGELRSENLELKADLERVQNQLNRLLDDHPELRDLRD